MVNSNWERVIDWMVWYFKTFKSASKTLTVFTHFLKSDLEILKFALIFFSKSLADAEFSWFPLSFQPRFTQKFVLVRVPGTYFGQSWFYNGLMSSQLGFAKLCHKNFYGFASIKGTSFQKNYQKCQNQIEKCLKSFLLFKNWKTWKKRFKQYFGGLT